MELEEFVKLMKQNETQGNTDNISPENPAPVNYAYLANKKLVEETTVPTLYISLTDTKTSIFESKIGGTPYLPRDMEIPKDKNGKQMKLLAQFDCTEFSELEDYPHTGILQFWLTTDYSWDDYRVTYHENIDMTLTEDEVLTRIDEFIDGKDGDFPVTGEYGVDFTSGSESMSIDDERVKALFCQYYTEISGEYISEPEYAGNGDYGSEVYDVFEECSDHSGFGSKIGGYRSIAQLPDYLTYRPKEYRTGSEQPWEKYTEEIDMKSDDCDLLLFQLYSNSSGKVMWGDFGAAQFHIKRRDLKNRNFNAVYYHWDCS